MHFLLQPPPKVVSNFTSRDTHLKGKLSFAFRLFPYNEADNENKDCSNNPYCLYQRAWLKGSQDTAAHDKETCEQTPKAYQCFIFYIFLARGKENPNHKQAKQNLKAKQTEL